MIAFANGHALQDGAAIVSCINSKNNQGIDVKHHAKLLLVFTTAFTQIALAQQELSYSESRDAAIGGFDISPKSPMFGELESLLAWSQK